MLEKFQVIIFVGKTGSGKTTKIPLWCMEWQDRQQGLRRQVVCTLPGQVAAMNVATSVSKKLKVTLGQKVGYRIKFKDSSSQKTMLKYSNDEMLLHEAICDPLFDHYAVVVLDDVHQRSLSTDILVGVLKEVILKRADMKIVVISATLETGNKFQKYFGNAPLLTVPVSEHPVETFYSPVSNSNYVEAAIQMVIQILDYEEEGDILLFLTGQKEIKKACKRIRRELKDLDLEVDVNCVPLYSSLTQNLNRKNSPSNGPIRRNVFVSTNVAETSVHLDSVVFVIDPGFEKQKVYNPINSAQSLFLCRISKESANQRTACASQTRAGKCYRLYSKKAYEIDMQDQAHPEITRSNIEKVVLQLKQIGINDLVHFDYMDPPAPQTLSRALENLFHLGCLNTEGDVTELGSIIAEFPLEPQLTKMLISSCYFKCANEVLSIISMLTAPDCFLMPAEVKKETNDAKQRFAHIDSDHISLLNVYHAYKIKILYCPKQLDMNSFHHLHPIRFMLPHFFQQHHEDVEWCYKNGLNHKALVRADEARKKLALIMDRLNLSRLSTPFGSNEYYTNIRKALVSGFFMQVAHLESSGYYSTIKDKQVVQIHPSTCLNHKPEWLIFHEMLNTTENFIYKVTKIKPHWLMEIASLYYDLRSFPQCEAKYKLEFLFK